MRDKFVTTPTNDTRVVISDGRHILRLYTGARTYIIITISDRDRSRCKGVVVKPGMK